MTLDILRDRRVRSVSWRDLIDVSWREVLKELLLPVPWLSGKQVV